MYSNVYQDILKTAFKKRSFPYYEGESTCSLHNTGCPYTVYLLHNLTPPPSHTHTYPHSPQGSPGWWWWWTGSQWCWRRRVHMCWQRHCPQMHWQCSPPVGCTGSQCREWLSAQWERPDALWLSWMLGGPNGQWLAALAFPAELFVIHTCMGGLFLRLYCDLHTASNSLPSQNFICTHIHQHTGLPKQCHLNLSTLSLEALKLSQEREDKWEDEVEGCDDHWRHQTLQVDNTVGWLLRRNAGSRCLKWNPNTHW